MKISVVTVCYNEKRTIKATIESVISQDYDDYEYVIIDGASSDGTVEIIKEYEKTKRLHYYSEKDNGLYDAMNKSLDRITGEYVIFMNSGDMFYNDGVLSSIAPLLEGDVVYGDVYRRCNSGNFVQRYKGTQWERIRMMLCGLAFCHQTQFTRTDLMRSYRFRLDHRITADFDFVVRTLADKRSFKHVNLVICSFDNEDGISAQKENYDRMISEDDASIKEFFPVLYYLTILPKKLFRLCFR